jgi:hypothetical protein
VATKPLTTPEIWASNAVYTTGPFIGQPGKVVPPGATAAEGHRPGANFPTPAEYENSQQNEITTWITDWLALGSSTGAANAHVVETNAAGRTQLQGLTILDSVVEIACSITGIGVVVPALLVTNTSGGGAIDATIGNTTGVAIAAQVGSGAGTGVLVTMTATPAGGEGVLVTTSGATAAPAIKVDHNSTGIGVYSDVTGGSGRGLFVEGNASALAADITAGAGQVALQATSGSNGAAAIAAIGSGTALGIEAAGGNGSSAGTAVRGTATHDDAMGIVGRTTTTASLASAGVLGEGRGTGIGVWGRNTVGDGYGVVAQSDSSAPEYAAMQLIQQNSDPVNAFGGDLLSHGTMNQLRHGASTGVFHGVYQSPADVSGCSANLLSIASGAVYTNNSGVSWTDTIFPSLTDDGNGYYGQGPGAELTFHIVMDCRLVTASANHIEVQVVDLTNGGAVIFSRTTAGGTLTDGYYMGLATTEWQRAVAIMFQYSPPSEGALDFSIQIRKAGSGAGTNVEARDIGCTILGTIVP